MAANSIRDQRIRLGLAGCAAVMACIAIVWAARSGAATPVPAIDKTFVDKSERKLSVLSRGKVVRSFQVALGFGGLAPKARQGDGGVPEGVYRITAHNPNSVAHKSLRIDYPNAEQRAAAKRGCYDPDGDIMIHGLMNG